MSSTADTTPAPRRRYDSEASRGELLAAATALFDERGYDATTLRDIGERARVDPALIARYFGGKESLYLATVREGCKPQVLPCEPTAAFAAMLTKTEERGIGPVERAMVSSTLPCSMREQVDDIVGSRILEPLGTELASRGATDPELRAELLFALAIGLSLTRASGTLPRLAEIPAPELLALLEPTLAALQGSGS
jgi:AcrR family transcriptional regulator